MTTLSERNLTYKIGTITIANGATTVIGTSTLWDTSIARQWDFISIDNEPLIPITSFTDASHIEIPARIGATKTNVNYVIYQLSPLRYFGGVQSADVDNMLASLDTEGWYRFVKPSAADPTAQGIVANEGQYALQYTTGKLWVMSGGAWVFVGVYRALNPRGAWSSVTAYNPGDIVSYTNGSSYIASQASTNIVPTNTAYWTLNSAQGPAALTPVTPWATATNYVVGPPASFVSISGASYMCLVSHTSGTFATDLAAGKWGIVVAAAKGYGATSTATFTIDGTIIGSKAFTGIVGGAAYIVGDRVHVGAQASPLNWVEGYITAYAGNTMTVNVTDYKGSGSYSLWGIGLTGNPGTVTGINIPAGHICGIKVEANVLDANNDQDFSDGECASDEISPILMRHSAGTAQIDVAYGTGNGGRFDAADSAGDWHCFVISNGTTVSRGYSKSLNPTTAPNYPAGYTHYRRVATRVRVGTTFVSVRQIGKRNYLLNPHVEYNGASIAAKTAVPMRVPATIQVVAIFNASLTTASGASLTTIFPDPDQTDLAPSVVAAPGADLIAATITGQINRAGGMFERRTDGAGNIYHRDSAATGNIMITTLGWIDDLVPT